MLCKKNFEKPEEENERKKERTQRSVSQFTLENTGSITERDNLQMEFFFSLQFCTSVATFNVIKFAYSWNRSKENPKKIIL